MALGRRNRRAGNNEGARCQVGHDRPRCARARIRPHAASLRVVSEHEGAITAALDVEVILQLATRRGRRDVRPQLRHSAARAALELPFGFQVRVTSGDLINRQPSSSRVARRHSGGIDARRWLRHTRRVCLLAGRAAQVLLVVQRAVAVHATAAVAVPSTVVAGRARRDVVRTDAANGARVVATCREFNTSSTPEVKRSGIAVTGAGSSTFVPAPRRGRPDRAIDLHEMYLQRGCDGDSATQPGGGQDHVTRPAATTTNSSDNRIVNVTTNSPTVSHASPDPPGWRVSAWSWFFTL